MARYIIQNEETKAIKKVLPKFGSLQINNSKIKGGVRIIGYRKYSWGEQVDIEFIGKIYARVTWGKMEWFDSSIMNNKDVKVSKVKVNRLIRRNLLNDVKLRLNYFGININEHSQITKLKWL
jgi:hypothetical protein